ncbi:MAG: 3-deoxy-D-manno-octulosonic acid transferase, partial [Alphaproteobacteria bacterium]
ELWFAYILSRLAFVGKSLCAKGGHNMLEPAGLGVPILFGPHVENFAAESALLVKAGAARIVRNEKDLWAAARDILSDDSLAASMGRAGRDAILTRQGATQRHLDVIRTVLASLRGAGRTT